MKIPEHIDWSVWRIVRAGYASLVEVQTAWTCLDVLDAHDVLDLEEQI